MKEINHYYIYYLNQDEDKYFFDRTMPDEANANKRVQELEGQGKKAVWIKNHLIKGAFN